MTVGGRSAERRRATRRTFVGTVGAALTGAFAGCFRDDGAPRSGNEAQSEGAEGTDRQRLDEGELGSIAAARSQLRATYERLARVPVTENGAFVFDTGAFVDEFGDGSSLSVSESPSEVFRASTGSESGISEEKANRLAAAADLSVWLFNQRLLLFDTIVSGRMFTRTYKEGYERPIEHLRNGLEKLHSAPKNRSRIHASLSHFWAGDIDINGYDFDTVRPATGITDEIAAWTTPAYEGLLHTTRGRMLIETVETSARSDALFPHSKRDYERIAAEFRTAETSFNHAHGRGRRLGHMSDAFEYHRCVASAMRNVFDDAVAGNTELEAGNDAEAERIASDIEDRLSRLVLRCS